MALSLPAPMRDAWLWWSGELAAILGDSAGDGADETAWKLEAYEGQLALYVGRERAHYLIDPQDELQERPDGLPGARGPIVLRIDPDLVLVQQTELPLAAEDELRRVLGYQMDRETPFTLDRVYFDHRVIARDRSEQQLQVELVVLPRALLDPVLDHLQHWGVELAAVRVTVDEAEYDLLPAERRARPSRWPRLVNGLLLVTAIGLLGVGLALPIMGKQQVVDQLEPRLAAARKDAIVVNQLRKEIDGLTDRLSFAVREKAKRTKLTDVLNEMTRLLPDDTWLSEMEIVGGEVQIRGEAPNAAQLVGLLESAEAFSGARFRSPVVQAAGTGLERFHLSVEFREQAL